MIPRIFFVVDREEAKWTVGCGDGDGSGCFPSRRAAMEFALREAERVRSLGYEIDVLVRRRNGSVRKLPDPARKEKGTLQSEESRLN
ncbi:hypothetical protein FHS63_003888 [Azospirillum doebereinerae]